MFSGSKIKQDRKCTYDVALRWDRAMESNTYYISYVYWTVHHLDI